MLLFYTSKGLCSLEALSAGKDPASVSLEERDKLSRPKTLKLFKLFPLGTDCCQIKRRERKEPLCSSPPSPSFPSHCSQLLWLPGHPRGAGIKTQLLEEVLDGDDGARSIPCQGLNEWRDREALRGPGRLSMGTLVWGLLGEGAEAVLGTGLKLLHPLPGSEQGWERAPAGTLRVRSTDW